MSDRQNENEAVYTGPTPLAPEIDPAVYVGEKATTKKEFLKLPANKRMRSEINAAGILCYACAGVTLLACLVTGNLSSILDVLLLVGLGLGVHLAQNRVCAIILLVYGSLNTISMSMQMGSFSGYLPFLAGLGSTFQTFKLSKAWKAYNKF